MLALTQTRLINTSGHPVHVCLQAKQREASVPFSYFLTANECGNKGKLCILKAHEEDILLRLLYI
jgi:hypothetical protein